ncbi:MAG: D-glycero-beta-D-manno-heptose 1-phosphate adenylyltransferase [Actinomycetota bacterium]|nr:D-glycero-beta-D-manno-heptose 1-phosphate adenylyltransferase [Actinomycetota bacterium]
MSGRLGSAAEGRGRAGQIGTAAAGGGRARHIVVVGDALLDRDVEGTVERIAPDAPVPVVDEAHTHSRPGGAGLAAILVAADGRDVTLVAALADDDPGRELADLLATSGVTLIALPTDAPTPEKVRIRAGGRPLLRLDRGGRSGGRIGPPPPQAHAALAAADAVLVADYGRGMATAAPLRDLVAAVTQRVPVVWDPHPLGAQPLRGARLATPNKAEVERFVPDLTGMHRRGDDLTGYDVTGDDLAGQSLAAVTARARVLAVRWEAAGVVVTLGARGALLVDGDAHPLAVPAPVVAGGDPCGAGDRFAATAVGLLADGALPSEAVVGAVTAASAFVAAGGAAQWGEVVHGRVEDAGADGVVDAAAIVARVRARGGTVVATGGCFDLLHAGHVALLEAARALGDCLVVCVNSDSSVRRLKGAGRPLVGACDRVALLLALGCVDAVAVFGEDTPEAILERLRPDIWAKGADYAVADLPEAKVLERWGGQVVVLPYLEGRSTSELVGEVVRRGTV